MGKEEDTEEFALRLADLADRVAQERYPIGEHLNDWPVDEQAMQQIAWLACYGGVVAGYRAAYSDSKEELQKDVPAAAKEIPRVFVPDATIHIKTSEIQRLITEAVNQNRGELKELLTQIQRCILENHKHHEDYDDYGGYGGSELQELNIKALGILRKILMWG